MSQDYLKTAVEIAREAGAVLRARFATGTRSEACGEFDVVSDADTEVDALVVDRIRAAFPTHNIVAEQSGAHDGTSSAYRWHVDPLDGTKNFTRGNPAFSVSLALERESELIAGVVFDPMRDEIFTAERGAGAFRNGQRMQVSAVDRLGQCLLTTGCPSAKRHGQSHASVPTFHDLLLLSQGLRRTGSSALDLSYVACGRLDVFWDIGLRSWDVAGGVILITEAGGFCSDLRGAPFHAESADLLGTNAHVHQAMVSIFGVLALS
jgi:myo-inositol-1(or 4)-monophosphatase